MIGEIVDSETILTDGPAVEAGLAFLRAGGDFADGAIARQGQAAGGTVFASFDMKAVELWKKQGGQTRSKAGNSPSRSTSKLGKIGWDNR